MYWNRKQLLSIVIEFYSIAVFTVFVIKKCRLGEHKRLLKKKSHQPPQYIISLYSFANENSFKISQTIKPCIKQCKNWYQNKGTKNGVERSDSSFPCCSFCIEQGFPDQFWVLLEQSYSKERKRKVIQFNTLPLSTPALAVQKVVGSILREHTYWQNKNV